MTNRARVRDSMVLAAGFQAAYGSYMRTDRVGRDATVRHIMAGSTPIDAVWLRLAKEVIRQLDRPIELHLGAQPDDTEATA
jgi:hypothetical protein